jgi:AP-1-like factor
LTSCSEDGCVSNGYSSGFTATPGSDLNGINWLAQQNNNTFDPVLFGDYRETQDNVLSQDFGSFFNDAYPLPDLGSPLHNYTDLTTDQPPKHDLLSKVDEAKNEDVGPDQERPMTCNKIWSVKPTPRRITVDSHWFRDRLQSMEKFRNGEIDIDNLCSELRAKAKCSEGGAVVDRKDVEKILGGAA